MRHKPLIFLAGAAGVLAGMWWVMEPAVSAPAELVARGEAAAERCVSHRQDGRGLIGLGGQAHPGSSFLRGRAPFGGPAGWGRR